MPYYYVSTVEGDKGEHNVHVSDCKHGPALNHRKPIGFFWNCKTAVESAKTIYSSADGCFYCCNECHKK